MNLIHPSSTPCTQYTQYTMNYGGGLVAGDDVAIECAVGPGCTVAMTTQVQRARYECQARAFCP